MNGLAYTSGHVIGGRYRLLSKLGAGGMGEVWRAEHLSLKSLVAIKFIHPALAASGDALQRFMREAQACAALRSSHIVQVFDFGLDDAVPYIAMELLNGESLRERLQRQGVLTPAATSAILTQVARAMAHAHEAGVIHRDLKPDNIFIVSEQGHEIAKVLDFGVAKVTSAGLDDTTGGSTRTGAILGTPFYVSPEQARGNKAVDSRSDLWALGVISYECLTGRRPFQSEGLGDLLLQICGDPHPAPSSVATLAASFDHWMQQALHKSPDQRFASARQMAEAFQALVGQQSQPPTQQSQPPAQQSQPPAQQSQPPAQQSQPPAQQSQPPAQRSAPANPVTSVASAAHGLAVTPPPNRRATRSIPGFVIAGVVVVALASVAVAWSRMQANSVAPQVSVSAPVGAPVVPAAPRETAAPRPVAPEPAVAAMAPTAPLASPSPEVQAPPKPKPKPTPASRERSTGTTAAETKPVREQPTPAAPAAASPAPTPPAKPGRSLFDERF